MDTDTDPVYDVIIVGGGPAGLNAALMLGRACLRVVLVDAGQPRNAAARAIHGFLGRDGTNPRELLLDGRREIAKYGVEILDDEVIAAQCRDLLSPKMSPDRRYQTFFTAQTRGGRKLGARKLLLASGTRDTLPDFPGVRECYGATIHHCPYCDGWEHRGKHLLAFGDTPAEAVGLGLALRGWSGHVTVLTHGRNASAQDKDRLEGNGIRLSEEKIVRVVHAGDRMQGVEFQSKEFLSADAMFFNTAQHGNSELAQSLGCELKEESRARTGHKQKTNVPGLFLAGDADGDVQFVVVAAAEGATAATAIHRELQDEDRT